MASAAEIARAYDAYVSALWRGDADVAPFGVWLGACWRAGPAPMPAAPPAAISPCGGGGRGITWHDTPAAVLGCVPGADGRYVVPPEAVPPMLSPAPDDLLVNLRHGEDPTVTAPASSCTIDVREAVVATRTTHDGAVTGPCG